jgi:beta-lactamase family protein
VHAGKLVCQWYGNGGTPDRPAAAFSVSKTVLSLMIARAAADGTLPGLDRPVTTDIPELAGRDPRFSAITLADLIDMRSGIAFSQDVPFPWVDRDQPAVYYATDLARTVVERPATTLGRITVGYHNGWWVLPGHDLAAMGDRGQIMIVSPSTDTVVAHPPSNTSDRVGAAAQQRREGAADVGRVEAQFGELVRGDPAQLETVVRPVGQRL